MKCVLKWKMILRLLVIAFIAFLIYSLVVIDKPNIVLLQTEGIRNTSPGELVFDGYDSYENYKVVFNVDDAVEAADTVLKDEQSFLSRLISNEYYVRYDARQRLYEVYRIGYFGDYDFYAYVYYGDKTVYYNND
ncbi:MAG: hypothetical protein KQ78_01184 [Candidatus Izimaplasma bacterium HR2]|nr:MAG: hypothetical protein KQ78_01184 [Candidatus Izimaplasma bacterium HR2]